MDGCYTAGWADNRFVRWATWDLCGDKKNYLELVSQLMNQATHFQKMPTIWQRMQIMQRNLLALGFVKFGIIGVVAALGASSIAYYKAYQEQEKLNKSVIMTGEYSGLTARQLSGMAYEVSKAQGQ